jgi:hypothetical protein
MEAYCEGGVCLSFRAFHFRHTGSLKMVVFWVVAPCSLVEVYRRFLVIALMETASTSETSVNFYQTTRRYNPENSHLHTRRREYLKSYLPVA